MITVKLPYTTTPEGVAELAVWQRHYNSVLRTCYQRIRAGKTQKDILPELRARKDGSFNSWLTLSTLSQAKGIHKAAQKTTQTNQLSSAAEKISPSEPKTKSPKKLGRKKGSNP